MGFDFLTYEPETPHIMTFIPPLAVAALFYLGNLIDVSIAHLRITRKANEAAWREKNDVKIQDEEIS